jgi:hypothetical protein
VLGFWEGFTAIPRDGPLVDGKGLMSVMFHSNTNPAMTPSIRFKFSDTNVFQVERGRLESPAQPGRKV